MATEFDILGGYVSQDAIKEFGDLGKAIDKSAESAAALLKSLEGIKAKQDYSKQAAKLAEINAKMEGQVATLNAKLEAREKEHQMKVETARTAHLAALERQEKAYQDKLALIIATQEKNTEAAATAHASKMEIINQKKADKAIAQAERQAKATAAALDRENAKVFKSSPEGVTQTVGLQAQAQVMKLNAVIASEYTSSLQKLDAQIKLNVIDAQKFVAASDTQNPKYLELIGNTKKLSTEYDRMAKAAGANMTKTNSMYGATFSLTQVMRELPNFAIDARIGFMALSNNLPMLAENFQNTTKEIDSMTGKAKGVKGALKEFGASLLSLNTIMIVATTAMVLWGDDIVNWAGKLFNATDVIDGATESMRDFNKEVENAESAGNKMKTKLNETKAVLEGTKKALETKDLASGWNNITRSLQLVKQTLGSKLDAGETNFLEGISKITDSNEKIKAVQKGLDLVTKYQDKVTYATNMQSAAQVELNNVTKLGAKIEENRNDAIEKAFGKNKNASAQELSRWTAEGERVYAQIQKAVKDARTPREVAQANELDAVQPARVQAYLKYKRESFKANIDLKKSQDAYNISIYEAALAYDVETKKDKERRGSHKKTFTEILVMEEFYDHERAMLIEKMAELEDDISKTTIKGEINGYEQRTTAAELYYETLKRLAMSDRDVAIATANEKLAHEKRVIKDKYDDNVRKFKLGSPEEKKSKAELTVGNATLDQNNFNDRLKIRDEYDKKVLDGSRKQASQLYTIQQDMYADEVYLLDQAQAKKLAALGISDSLQKQKTATKSGIELLNSNIGGSSDSKFQEIRDTENSAKQKLFIERDRLRKEISLEEVSGEKKKELRRKLDENLVAIDAATDTSANETVLENLRIVEDAKANIVSKSIDTLKSLWDSYYQYQADKLDATLDKQTKINTESVKQYEDETNVGKHSAKELSDFKDRTSAYQASQDEENSRKKKELAKQEFLEKQAFAVAEIWINYAINVAKVGVNPAAQGWLLASAIASTALVAAQTIPAFAEGGTMDKDGKALIGDGGKNELIMTPTGDWYVSPKVPTVVDMQAGTKIFPDINKLDLNSFLAMAQVQPQMLKTDNLEKEIKGLRQDVRNQKQGNFYGMPLIRQLNNSSRYSARKRGLMN